MKAVLLLMFIFLLTNSYSQNLPYTENDDKSSNPSIDAFVGDWVGTGWGWEIRFKQSAGEFGKQNLENNLQRGS